MIACLNPACHHSNPEAATVCEHCQITLRLCDRYRPTQLLGQGGFGRTFLAVDEGQVNHPACVIKQVWPTQFPDPDKIIELFHQEAQLLKELGCHPQIPQLLASVEQDDKLYVVQEYIDGQNLAQERTEVERFSPKQIQQLLAELLPVLGFIHQHQLLHRDIKPANIIRRSTDQQLVLVDFGAAKRLTGTAIAKTGTSIGSAEYIAPEQARGKAQFASDIYGLGVTCIHLLTGLSPFDLMDGDGQWIWESLCDQPIKPDLATVLNKMIAPAVSQRYGSVEDAIADLHTPAELKRSRLHQLVYGVGLIIKLFLASLLVSGGFGILLLLPKTSSPPSIPTAINTPQPSPLIPIPESPLPKIPTPVPATSAELKALENLILIANASGQYYQAHGQFLTDLSRPPALDQYTLQITKLGKQGLQVSGIPTTEKLRSFIILSWGGPSSASQNQPTSAKMQPSSNPLDDVGLFHLPNRNRSGKAAPHLVIANYCESLQPSQMPPPKADLPIRQPKTYKDWPCPEGYTFAFTATEIIGKLAATQSPSVLFQIPQSDQR
ncbi:serine/threonine-protein kinase [Acaryochloris sp. IP29b_bin.148]|uniref:serine/threonine-protein kinase n=1 Tax=Acaryochloris sp. IP29b_bin.148 TaxID=2969218 RepID=UPI0026076307|nr:serine/threonine-protein kinase [Acaryochloris sp. IP29b_bin.148]